MNIDSCDDSTAVLLPLQGEVHRRSSPRGRDGALTKRRGGVAAAAAARQTSGQSDAKASPVTNAPTACVGFTGNFV